MNNDKTKVVWFGCEQPPNIIYLPHLKFEWNPETFTLLGIEFTIGLENITDKNINKKLTEMTLELNTWSKRDLTPFGKITILKSIIISKIVHILIALPSPSDKMQKKINKLFYNFLWGGKPDLVKRPISIMKPRDGGLGMIDLCNFDKSLKLTWIKRFFNSKAKWKIIIESKYPKLANITYYGDEYIKSLIEQNTNEFWGNIFKYYVDFYRKKEITTLKEFDMQSFILNSKIKIGNKTITNRDLINKKIVFIGQLKTDQSYMNLNELNAKYQTNQNFLQYNSISSSIKKYESYLSLSKGKNKLNFQPALNTILENKSGTGPIYKEFINKNIKATGFEKWSAELGLKYYDWLKSFRILNYTTHDTKLRWLHFRILHHILTTNRSVSKYKENQNELCSFCKEKSETIVHLLWECHKSFSFWKKLADIFNKRCKHSFNFKFTKNLVLFGICDTIKTDKICIFIITLAKFYLYRCKVQSTNPSIISFIKELYNRYCIEKINNKENNNFKNSWAPYELIFKSLL